MDTHTLSAIELDRSEGTGRSSRQLQIIDDTQDIIESYSKDKSQLLDSQEQHSQRDDENDDDDDNDEDSDKEDAGDGSVQAETAQCPANDNLNTTTTFMEDQPRRPVNLGIVESPANIRDHSSTYTSDTTLLTVGFSNNDMLYSPDSNLESSSTLLPGSGLDEMFPEAPFIPPFSLGLARSGRSSPFQEPQVPVPEDQAMDLVRSYLLETATWCDTTDTLKHFSVLSAHDMLEIKIFKAAALAVASRQLNMLGVLAEDTALRCYQYTIRLLIQQDPDQTNAYVIATCILLCVYEMMASDAIDWRRHLKGCAGLFSMKGWNGMSEGLTKTCFWAFARIDLWAAFLLGKRTLIPTDHWVGDEDLQSAAAHHSLDHYCNLSILTFGRLVNSLAKTEGRAAAVEPTHNPQKLWKDFQDWWKYRPKRVKPLFRAPPTSLNPFPTIVFIDSSSNCGTTFFHTGSILLLTQKNIKDPSYQGDEMIDPLWHASELCGVSISNEDHANWVNHLQPLFVAGRQFVPGNQANLRSIRTEIGDTNIAEGLSSSPRAAGVFGWKNTVGNSVSRLTSLDTAYTGNVQFAAERMVLLQHLVRIQRETGWKTEGRAKELRKLWGLE